MMRKRKWLRKLRYVGLGVLGTLFTLHIIVIIIAKQVPIDIVLHRGATFVSTENTLSAILEGVALGFESFEIDVQLTKDNQVILFHDATLARLTGLNKRPSEMTYDEICAYCDEAELQPFFPLISYISLLEDVLKIDNGTMFWNIELKDYGSNDNLPYEVVKIIEKYEITDRCVVMSFSTKHLEKVHKLNPDITVGIITANPVNSYMKLPDYVTVYSVQCAALSPEITFFLHHNGKIVYAWTPNTRLAIQYAIYCKVDKIVTDNPVVARLQLFEYFDSEQFLNGREEMLQ